MSRGVVATTTQAREDLTPLVQRPDGRFVPASPSSSSPDASFPWPSDGPGFFGPSSDGPWMERESILPGFKNGTVLIGGGIALLALFLVMKPKQVIA